MEAERDLGGILNSCTDRCQQLQLTPLHCGAADLHCEANFSFSKLNYVATECQRVCLFLVGGVNYFLHFKL